MNWNVFLNEFSGRPLFHSSMLDLFPDPPLHKQVQLSRWEKAKKLSQLRRGWYIIEKPWRAAEVPLAVIANTIVHPSYLSLDWALQYYEMIPEYVPNPTSVTTGRGVQIRARNALFMYYHVQPRLFKGYRREKVDDYMIDIAYPEKALFDKIYLFLHRNRFSIEWLEELRLQNLDDFNCDRFKEFSRGTGKKGLDEAVESTCRYIRDSRGDRL